MLVTELILVLIFLLINYASAVGFNNSDLDITEFGHNAHRVFISPRIGHANQQIPHQNAQKSNEPIDTPLQSAHNVGFYSQEKNHNRINPSEQISPLNNANYNFPANSNTLNAQLPPPGASNNGYHSNKADQLENEHINNENNNGNNRGPSSAEYPSNQNNNGNNRGPSSAEYPSNQNNNKISTNSEVSNVQPGMGNVQTRNNGPVSGNAHPEYLNQRSNPSDYFNKNNHHTSSNSNIQDQTSLQHSNQPSKSFNNDHPPFKANPTPGNTHQEIENQGDPQRYPQHDPNVGPTWRDNQRALNQVFPQNDQHPANQNQPTDYSVRQPRINSDNYPRDIHTNPDNHYSNHPPPNPYPQNYPPSYPEDNYPPTRHVDPSPSHYDHEFPPTYPLHSQEDIDTEQYKNTQLHYYDGSNEEESTYDNPSPNYDNSWHSNPSPSENSNEERHSYSNYYQYHSDDPEQRFAYSDPYSGKYDEYASRKFSSHYDKPQEVVTPYDDRWNHDSVNPPYYPHHDHDDDQRSNPHYY